MNRPVRLTSAAEEDLQEARRWHQNYAPHADRRFHRAVREALQRIGESPFLYPIVRRDIRRAIVRGFQYSIFYRPGEEAVLVIAIVHQARHPRVWQRRS